VFYNNFACRYTVGHYLWIVEIMKFRVRKSSKHKDQLELYKKFLWWWVFIDCFYVECGESLAQATDRVIGYQFKKKSSIVLEVER